MNHNISLKPEAEQKAMTRDLKASLWANDIKIGKTTKGHVLMKIASLKDEYKIQDMTERLNKFLAMDITFNKPKVDDQLARLRQAATERTQRKPSTNQSKDGLWSRPIGKRA